MPQRGLILQLAKQVVTLRLLRQNGKSGKEIKLLKLVAVSRESNLQTVEVIELGYSSLSIFAGEFLYDQTH